MNKNVYKCIKISIMKVFSLKPWPYSFLIKCTNIIVFVHPLVNCTNVAIDHIH